MQTRFVLSAPKASLLPAHGLIEVAFLGRSNVGKSSLINALVQAKIARTSQTPGRTQAVNLFTVHAGFGDFALADLPGYGFARAPKTVRQQWGPLTQRYLGERQELSLVMMLFDARREPSSEDFAALEQAEARVLNRDVLIQGVVTKLDKLPKAKRKPRLLQLANQLGTETPLIGSSASLRLGLDALLRSIQVRVAAHPNNDGRLMPQT